MIHFVLLISRQGKTRLAKWYATLTSKEKARIIKECNNAILTRPPKLCNFIEWKNYKIIYRRYASLFFIMGVDQEDNELIVLELIHQFVEVLDRYFGNVCELDLIFNFHKAYFALDELLCNGEIQETSKKTVLRLIAAGDAMQQTPDPKAKERGW